MTDIRNETKAVDASEWLRGIADAAKSIGERIRETAGGAQASGAVRASRSGSRSAGLDVREAAVPDEDQPGF